MSNHPRMLCVTGPMEIQLSQKKASDIWQAFLNGGTSHSSNAATLPYIMRRCEREQIPYTLQAVPGNGYYIFPTLKGNPNEK